MQMLGAMLGQRAPAAYCPASSAAPPPRPCTPPLAGVWVPQLWVRELAGHSVVPGIQYELVLRLLRIDYVPFTGKGYEQFVAFAKGWLKAGVPVITISYIPDEEEPCEWGSRAGVMGIGGGRRGWQQ